MVDIDLNKIGKRRKGENDYYLVLFEAPQLLFTFLLISHNVVYVRCSAEIALFISTRQMFLSKTIYYPLGL